MTDEDFERILFVEQPDTESAVSASELLAELRQFRAETNIALQTLLLLIEHSQQPKMVFRWWWERREPD